MEDEGKQKEGKKGEGKMCARSDKMEGGDATVG